MWRTNPPRLFEVTIDGGGLRPLTQGAAATAAWSRDGKVLFFHSTADRAPNIWALSMADRREFQVTDLAGRAGNMVGNTLATDGRYLYFAWSEAESDLWVADVVKN